MNSLDKMENYDRLAEQLAEVTKERDEALARIADLERRSESFESKLGQLEANERVMILEDRIKASEPELLAEIERLKRLVVIAEAHEKAEQETTITLGKQVDELARKLADRIESHHTLAVRGVQKDARIEELTRKLAEQQAFISTCVENTESGDQFFRSELLESLSQRNELNKLLAEAKKQSMPEGWREAVEAMSKAKSLPVWDGQVPFELHMQLDVIFAMLSSAQKQGDE